MTALLLYVALLPPEVGLDRGPAGAAVGLGLPQPPGSAGAALSPGVRYGAGRKGAKLRCVVPALTSLEGGLTWQAQSAVAFLPGLKGKERC